MLASSPPSSYQSSVAATSQAAEVFDIFDLADSGVTVTALSERVASLEGRLSVLEARLLAVTMPTDTMLLGIPLEPEGGAADAVQWPTLPAWPFGAKTKDHALVVTEAMELAARDNFDDIATIQHCCNAKHLLRCRQPCGQEQRANHVVTNKGPTMWSRTEGQPCVVLMP